MQPFWPTYRQRILLVAGLLFLCWLPSLVVAMGVAMGTVPPDLLGARLYVAYDTVLGFPLGHLLYALLGDAEAPSYLVRLLRALVFGAVYLADALLYAILGFALWSRRPGTGV